MATGTSAEENDGKLGHAPQSHTNGPENMLPSEEIESREEDKEEGEDLEEGEIEDDDDEEVKPQQSAAPPATAAAENGTSKLAGSHPNEDFEKKSRHHSDRGGRRGVDDDDRRDKRRRKKRKRGHGPDDDADPKRKRRGPEEDRDDGGDDDHDDEDPDMMYVRGNSPVGKAADGGPYDDAYGPGPYESPYNSDDSEYRRSASPQRRGDRGPRAKNRRNRGPAREERSRRHRDRDRDRDRDSKDRTDRRDRSDRRRNEKGGNGKSDTICGFYLEGKCSRDNDCPFSHAAVPPRKLELCKFYLMECCAKKEKCLYMHKDFPCKFYHTGRKCRSASAAQCKFSHEPLTDTTRAILIKHLESAPKEILGDFPRLTREEAVEAIANTVNGVLIPREKRPHIPPIFDVGKTANAPVPPAAVPASDPLGLGGKDVDMRDVDYRFPNSESQKLWAAAAQQFQQQSTPSGGEAHKAEQEAGGGIGRPRFYQEQTVTSQTTEVKDPIPSIASPESEKESKTTPAAGIWFRQLEANGSEYLSDGGLVMDIPGEEASAEMKTKKDDGEIKKEEDVKKEKDEGDMTPSYAAMLPQKQSDIYERFQSTSSKAKQEVRSPDDEPAQEDYCYSSDDDDARGKSLTDILKKINSADGTVKSETTTVTTISAGQNVNLGSLSNLNLSNIKPEDLAQMLSVIKSQALAKTGKHSPDEPASSTSSGQTHRDPRLSRDPRMRSGDVDLRVRTTSAAEAAFRGVDQQRPSQDVDLRVGTAQHPSASTMSSNDVDLRAALSRPLGSLDDAVSDVDLRRLSGDLLHTFKPPPLLPPAKEIDASFHAHAPVDYHVIEVKKALPDYSYVRFNPSDPQAINDPRLNRSKHGDLGDRPTSTVQDTEPLGPASPDPPSRGPSGGGYGYGPEIGSPDQSSVLNRRDPRVRSADIRRMPVDRQMLLPTVPVVPTPVVVNPPPPVYAPPPSARDPRGKPGLLGAAPPGMSLLGGEGPPQHAWGETSMPSYVPRPDEYPPMMGGAMGGAINRRDPRQHRRVSNETSSSGEERPRTPPLKSVFREKDPTASPFS